MKHLKLFFALFAMLALGVTNTWGAGSYVKVTTAPADWSGDYLIVYEEGNLAFDGALSADAAKNTISVTITDSKITSTDATDAAKFTIAKSSTGYTIKSASGYYIGQTADGNKVLYSTSAAYDNSISLNDDGSAHVVASGKPVLRYNATSGQERFRYFKSTTYTAQQVIHLYKYVEEQGGGEAPVTPTQLSAPANLTEGAITETSATLSWDAVANASNYSVTIDGKTATANTNLYDATGLTAGTSYTWSVVAKGDGTNYTDSEAAEHTFTTTTATVTPEPGTGSETATATLTFDANKANRTSFSTTQQVWAQNGVTFTNNKASSTSNVADYGNPVRLYKSSEIVVECSKGNMTKIVFTASGTSYATVMSTSLGTSLGTVTTDGNDVILTLSTPATATSAISLSNQVRLNSITVTYEKVVSADPVITCGNVNFGVVSANVNTTKELVVEAENLTENITAVLTLGTNFAVSGDLTTTGGTLTLSVTATEEGTYTDKLTLTSGTTIKEVEVSATVVVCQGKGTEENPYTINDVIKLANPSPTITAWVEGYIVGVMKDSKLAAPDSETNTNIVLATSATETEKFVPVALPVGDIREALNLVDHSEYLGKKVAVYGTLENYYSTTGVKNVTNYQWVSTEGDVAAPVIEGDEYFEESTTITITAAEGTTIYYTIGETTPDKNANQYSESFTVNETKTINAIAYDANGNASEVTTKTFTKLSTLTCEAALSETAIDVNYIVKGYVTEINTAYSSSYNNITFSMADTQGGTPVLKAYRVKPKDTDDSTVQVGDLVKVIGKLTQFDGTNQIAQGGEYEILTESKNPIISGVETFADKTTVTITARDGLTIYYTLDNTDPTNGSNKYEAPFELTETKTVKAVTFDGTSYSDIVEKTFTKTETPTKTVAEFIEAGGTRCYLEGIVSGLAEGNSMKYGNFDLTDASGAIYVYGCLNNAGEAQKFAELGVKNGDKIKVIAEEYELYGGTKHEAKNVQYVSHISAASITIENITMKVDEVATITATVDPADAVVTYTIKENAANAISLEGNTITALAEGTATITATVAEGANYMGNSVDFTVTVTANGQGGEEPEPVKQYYEKVTSEPTDWSGEYILVYDDGEGNSYVWNGKDEANGYISATSSNNVISGTFVTITIAPMTDGYSVQVNGGDNDDKYIYGTSGSNKLNFGTTAQLNTISYSASGVDLVSNGSTMRFNSANNQMRFRYYNTGQSVVTLYKLVETPQEPEEIEITLNDMIKIPNIRMGMYSHLSLEDYDGNQLSIYNGAEDAYGEFEVDGYLAEYDVTASGTGTWALVDGVETLTATLQVEGDNSTIYIVTATVAAATTESITCTDAHYYKTEYNETVFTGIVNEMSTLKLTVPNLTTGVNTATDFPFMCEYGPMFDPQIFTATSITVTVTELTTYTVEGEFNDEVGNTYNITITATPMPTENMTITNASYEKDAEGNIEIVGVWNNTTVTFTLPAWAGENGEYAETYLTTGTGDGDDDFSATAGYAVLEEVDNKFTLTGKFMHDWEAKMYNVSVSGSLTAEEPTPDYIREGLTAGNYGTICLPNGSSNYTGAEFYEFVGKEEGKAYLASVTTLEAGVPYIFRATASEVAVYSDGTTAATPGEHNGLVGTFTDDTEVTVGNYILFNNAICEVTAPCWVNANRAYIVWDEIPAGAPQQMPGRRYIGLDVHGENGTTGLDNIMTTDAPVKAIENGQLIIIRNGEKYNVQGVRL